MKIISECYGNVEVIVIKGSIDVHSVPEFVAVLEKKLENGTVNMVFDMRGVPRISSYGIGAITSTHIKISKQGGAIRLVALQPKVEKVLTTTKILSKFLVFENTEDAVKSFS